MRRLSFTGTVTGTVFFLFILLLQPAFGVNIGGSYWNYDFDENAFVDSILDYDLSNSTPPLDYLLNSIMVEDGSLWIAEGDFISFSFDDNFVFNGPGYDIAIFEYGVPETVGVSVACLTEESGWSEIHEFLSIETGVSNLQVSLVDLDDFGFDFGEIVDAIRLEGIGTTYLFEATGIGALNNTFTNTHPSSILDFFDQAISNGTLIGNGPGKSSRGRMKALRKMIKSSIKLYDSGLCNKAGLQLLDVHRRTDGIHHPPDFVCYSLVI